MSRQALAPSTSRIFVARQPILDRRQRISGYELLYRGSADATRAEFPDVRSACVRTLVNVFVDMGPDALLGSHRGFLNVSGELLRSDLVEALPKDRVVIEILESEAVDVELERRCRELVQLGFALALDDFVPGDGREALLPVVDYVKVDLAGTSGSALRRLVPLLRRHPPRVSWPRRWRRASSTGLAGSSASTCSRASTSPGR